MAATRGTRSKKSGAQERLSAAQVDGLRARAQAFRGGAVLVTGPEAGLARLLVRDLVDAVRRSDPGIVTERIAASNATAAGSIADAAAPTLFGGTRLVIVEDLDTMADGVAEVLKDLMAQFAGDEAADGSGSADGVSLVLVHGGGPRGRAIVTAAEGSGVMLLKSARLRRDTYADVIVAHARHNGADLAPMAAALLVDLLGEDLEALLSATDQLIADSPVSHIDADQVRGSLFGPGDANQFALADAVFNKERGRSLELFARLVAIHGEQSASILTASALSFGLRSLAKMTADGPRSRRPSWEIARDTGVPAWKVAAVAEQLRHWPRKGDLAAAAVRLASADAELKGGLAGENPLDPAQKALLVQHLILRLTAAPA